MSNHWHTSPHTFYSAKYTSANSLAEAILPNHWHRQFCQITGTLLHIQGILPNHWQTPPHPGNSAKSLAHCPQTDTSAQSLARQFCQITGMLLHIQAILPNHWHTVNRQKILPNHWHMQFSDKQFCQITDTGNSTKSLACSSSYMQFCQIAGTLSTDRHFCQITGTGKSAKSLAH
jgi:hypothetical protein